MSQYPEDEFDVAARERAPEGVHRAPRSGWAVILPYVLVIVIVPLLAWGAISLLNEGDDEEPVAEPTPEMTTEAATEEPTEEETEEEEEESTDEEEETPTAEELDEDVSTSTSIAVLNGTDVSGAAADAVDQLQAEGFSTVAGDNYGSSAPASTTLYYRSSELAPTAEAIGEILGISNLVEEPSATQNSEIAIVLRGDITD